MREKSRYGTTNYSDKIAQYQEQEAVLKERNRYSGTDTEATFIRMKDEPWPAQAGLQCTDIHFQSVYCRLYHPLRSYG